MPSLPEILKYGLGGAFVNEAEQRAQQAARDNAMALLELQLQQADEEAAQLHAAEASGAPSFAQPRAVPSFFADPPRGDPNDQLRFSLPQETGFGPAELAELIESLEAGGMSGRDVNQAIRASALSRAAAQLTDPADLANLAIGQKVYKFTPPEQALRDKRRAQTSATTQNSQAYVEAQRQLANERAQRTAFEAMRHRMLTDATLAAAPTPEQSVQIALDKDPFKPEEMIVRGPDGETPVYVVRRPKLGGGFDYVPAEQGGLPLSPTRPAQREHTLDRSPQRLWEDAVKMALSGPMGARYQRDPEALREAALKFYRVLLGGRAAQSTLPWPLREDGTEEFNLPPEEFAEDLEPDIQDVPSAPARPPEGAVEQVLDGVRYYLINGQWYTFN